MNKERLMKVLLSPHISEKSTQCAESNRQFVFKVLKNANKSEVGEAVEFLFNVRVKSVSTIVVKGKQKRFGKINGKRSDWKKAYVTLAQGDDINFANIG